MPAAIACSGLSFSWPDGTVVLSGLSAAFSPGRTGLIGVNGSGKSTLLRLIAGRLAPSVGSVTVNGDVGYLPQDLTLDVRVPVAGLLGIQPVRDAIAAIESGDVSPALFDTVGDDWDIEDRARAGLDRLGLAHVGLDDPAGNLSGGEAVLTALTALFLRRPDVILLDEPTNNLDSGARGKLYEAVDAWPGVMVIVSHDRELLAHVDQIADLSGGEIRFYGGNLEHYQAQRAAERAAAEQAVTSAAAEVRREKRDLAEAQAKQARRDRMGRQQQLAGGMPRIVAQGLKRKAQATAGKSRELHAERVEAATARLREAEGAVRDDAEIRIDLPGTAVPAGRTLLTVTGLDSPWRPAVRSSREDPSRENPSRENASPSRENTGQAPAPGDEDQRAVLGDLIVRGPERIWLTGPNGAGKTTLLRAIAGRADLDGVAIRRHVPVGFLPQRLDILDESLTVAQNVHAAAPEATPNEVRAGLARFLFRGARAEQVAGGLSGGERFRAVLATLLLAQPPPQLLVLDEPTNNLDMASVSQLEAALRGYRGGLLVVSHDNPFAENIGIDRRLRITRDGRVTEGGCLGALLEACAYWHLHPMQAASNAGCIQCRLHRMQVEADNSAQGSALSCHLGAGTVATIRSGS
ncbi:MAG: ABC-F family ATP-binding cassette domain-containing protein [Nocardiopsaceae bacterium]|nr:ABC-F family ATP-binding cassette domain-containing protein [Nocardiopsaceae bacterium]